MYFLGKAPDPTCDQVPELLAKAQFFSTAEGGRSKQHQKEAVQRAKELQVIYDKCQALQQDQDLSTQQQVQQIFRPEGVTYSSNSKWIWYVAGGVVAIGLGAWFFTRKSGLGVRIPKLKYRFKRRIKRRLGRIRRSARRIRRKLKRRSYSKRYYSRKRRR